MRIRVKNSDPKIMQKTSTFSFYIFSPIVGPKITSDNQVKRYRQLSIMIIEKQIKFAYLYIFQYFSD